MLDTQTYQMCKEKWEKMKTIIREMLKDNTLDYVKLLFYLYSPFCFPEGTGLLGTGCTSLTSSWN